MTTPRTSRAAILRKFGTAAFLFFLIKGLVWLAVGGAVLVSAL